MKALQYIPLSVRVKSWNLSLLSKNELSDLPSQELSTIIQIVTDKEKQGLINSETPMSFIKSLKNSVWHYVQIALKLTSAEAKSFVRELLREPEISNLKLVVKMLIANKFNEEFINIFLTPSISQKSLSEVRSFNDLIHLLNDTVYEHLIPTLQKTEQEQNSLYWEAALDNFYTTKLYVAVKQLDFQSRLLAKKIILLPTQFNQLVSIYRYRFHYNVDPSDVMILVPNTVHLLTFEEWNKLIHASSPSEFMEYLEYHHYVSDTDSITDATSLRLIFRQKTEQFCRRELYKQLIGISSFLAFYQLKKIQFQKISTIIESKLMHNLAIDIRNFL